MKIPKEINSPIVLAVVMLGSFLLITLIYFSGIFKTKTPILTILEPENNSSIQASSVIIKGKVKPTRSTISINGTNITKKGRNFSYTFNLDNKEEINNINIIATNKKKSSNQNLVINRIFTEEEKQQIEAEKSKKEKERLDKIAQEEAEREAYYKTPAGKICKEHFDWNRVECERLANREVWIGMSLDMLKYLRGLPNVANPSNYGYGTQWQWCWTKYTPSCFYDYDGDLKIDSYN